LQPYEFGRVLLFIAQINVKWATYNEFRAHQHAQVLCQSLLLTNDWFVTSQDLPQLIEGRIDYFEPSFEAMIRSGVRQIAVVNIMLE